MEADMKSRLTGFLLLVAMAIAAFLPAQSVAQSPAKSESPLAHVAQAANETPARMAQPSRGESKRIDWLSSLEFALSSAVLIFGVLVFCAELFIIRSGAYSPNQSTKLVAVTLIIIATLFIITAGFSSEQIAPAMGLFGTVAGYLLGRSQAASEVKDA
jgi:hypothetical protein